MLIRSILWRGIYLPGHEACRLISEDNEHRLEGTAVLLHDHQPCRLEYFVVCDEKWNTLRASVSGWVGSRTVKVEVDVSPDHHWRMNGVERPLVEGCYDLDLNFSPSTNLLPIRRLNLGIGQHAEVKAAWLRFPGFELERLDQIYRRFAESTYRYESGGGKFVTDLTVDSVGIVTNYPSIWQAEE